jgi:hypothetical protein
MEDLTIKIQWHHQDSNWWNEICATVLEVFGMPGNRFVYKPFEDFMTFTFKSKKDYNLCRILLSEYI